MNEKQLKRALADVHIKDDMQQRLMDNFTSVNENNTVEWRPAKMRKFNKMAVITASLALVLGFSTIAYGQGIYEKIREIVLGGYAHYIIDADTAESEADAGSDLGEAAYFVAGEDAADEVYCGVLTFSDAAEVQAYLEFDLKIPSYLPTGYTLDRIDLYDANGEVSGQYASVYFTKGAKYIYLQARLMNEETSFAAELGRMEEVEINGYKGLMGRQNLDVYIDGVLYAFSARSADVNSGELVKMVESY